MRILPEKLREIAVGGGFVSEEEFEKAAKAAKDLKRPLEDILIFRGLISEESLGQLIAEHYKAPFISLRNKVIPLEILELIPEKLARSHRVLPFEKKEKELYLAMEDPEDFEAIEFVRRQTGLKVKPYFATPEAIGKSLGQYKKNIRREFEKIISENIRRTKGLESKDLSKVAQDVPVVKIFDTLLEYAAAEGASDMHIELMADGLVIRFRIDGILRDIIALPKSIHPALVARIKILTNLKVDEQRVPQDGRFKFKIDQEGDYISLRVSVLPAFYGEGVVLRLLFESARPLSLEELGISGKNLKVFISNIKKPHGMILATGPTGCGKTTTLYSILNILNTAETKICTVEDPIEYAIRRITQIQVNPVTGLTFAAGLRSLVRHDPDMIMVGEIRDKETMNTAIHSALTGHLVLSTLHTNDAAGAIPRLLDMGAEGFLVASTVNAVIAQRLVRRICTACIVRFRPEKEAIKLLEVKFGERVKKQDFYRGKGCEECGGKGYKGRIGLFEILEVNDQIRELITQKVAVEKITKAAIDGGMVTMLIDGLDKIAAGITTVEEVLRVAQK